MLTAWDGYTRVDYLHAPGRVRISLLTVEPVVHRRIRRGLACAFAAGDLTGPPAVLELDVGWGETEDLLLGPRLMDVITGIRGPGSRSRSIRLELDEVAALADRWAPYRSQVLGVPAESGRLADGFWTSFLKLGLAKVIRSLPVAADPVYRAGDDCGFAWQPLRLPVPLAQDAGVEPLARWVAYRQLADGVEESGVVIHATALPGRRKDLHAGLDDRDDSWVVFEPDPDDPTLLVAELPVVPGRGEPALRFRTEGRWPSRSIQTC
ncbi:hypothetical protein ABZ345_08445 [Lentzea sp. NPDC005914]|uniref:hypothetical protein n=1 Tax=Lentzea sp. NPDC005914 TaxID=3154572 RepID=UPI0033C9AB40